MVCKQPQTWDASHHLEFGKLDGSEKVSVTDAMSMAFLPKILLAAVRDSS